VIHFVSRRTLLVVGLAVAFLTGSALARQPADPLASWNDGAAKKSITDFVARVTMEGGADFVPPAERIAAFDNDGTLWAEQPVYFQLQMLQWTAAGRGARFLGLVHHTDAAREYAYDRQSRIGKLDKALDEATARNWTLVDMKADWRTIFPAEDMPAASK
jgi:hypothetical protein